MLHHHHSTIFCPTTPLLSPIAAAAATTTTTTTIRNVVAFSISKTSRHESVRCSARRRVRYQEPEEEEYGDNLDIALLESYSESARNEALLVRASVDDREELILVYKGFSSCLSYNTSPDPSTSILPARAVITSIDRVVAPFDPSNIVYIHKDLTWDAFISSLHQHQP